MKEGANPNNSIETMLEDDTKPSSYYGPAKDRPRLTFNSFKDVLLGDFFFVYHITTITFLLARADTRVCGHDSKANI